MAARTKHWPSDCDMARIYSAANLSDFIRTLIVNCGLTNKELAEETGVSASVISHIATRRSDPSLDTLERFLRYFGIQLTWTWKNDPHWRPMSRPSTVALPGPGGLPTQPLSPVPSDLPTQEKPVVQSTYFQQ